MHNPRPQLAAHSRQTPEMMQQRIHQRAAIARIIGRTCASVNHHSRRLVDYGQIVIFINDVERNLLGNSLERRALRLAQHADPLPAAQLQRGFCWRIVYQYLPFGNHFLNAGAADGIEARGEELIETLACAFRCDGDKNGK